MAEVSFHWSSNPPVELRIQNTTLHVRLKQWFAIKIKQSKTFCYYRFMVSNYLKENQNSWQCTLFFVTLCIRLFSVHSYNSSTQTRTCTRQRHTPAAALSKLPVQEHNELIHSTADVLSSVHVAPWLSLQEYHTPESSGYSMPRIKRPKNGPEGIMSVDKAQPV